jgi:hypothetical protein
MNVAFEEKLAILSNSFEASDLLVELGVDYQVEVVIDFI